MTRSSGRRLTSVMITNSVEEAMLLSDRIIPLSRGPKATLGPSVVPDSEAEIKILEYLTGTKFEQAVEVGV